MLISVLQVKVAILKYIDTLTLQMEAPDFVNSSETRLAISRIITWTTEPKSSDVRKVRTHRQNKILFQRFIIMLLERIATLSSSRINININMLAYAHCLCYYCIA